ncbi:hypothetical protein [Streptomonospora wellingtoniae]|uniref:Uncharacterized protein n=1 Tax=Streptomonospora wellingtoniae TaxID=3075544 RepID=A0ABU2KX62_9ACTN|nr:hypothetical protein [Streptomonospora sp. DSM 45055]MDT0303837.1 hypothetical protein [Streptomonospora sp. DSM 45055]
METTAPAHWPIEIRTRIADLNRVNPSMYRVWGSQHGDGSFAAYYASLHPHLNRTGSRFAPTLASGSHLHLERLLMCPPDRIDVLRWPGGE